MKADIKSKVAAAREAALKLASASTDAKNRALEGVAYALLHEKERVLEANRKDLEAAGKLVEEGELSQALYDRLKLSEQKLDGIVEGVRSVARLEDPVGRTLSCTELDKGLVLYKVSVPIGVIGVVFESRPDVVPQISSLCLKSGNAVLMKGGREAKESNRVLADVIATAAEAVEGIPEGWLQLLEKREEVKAMLELDDFIDLLVPRGSNKFVKYIKDHTSIPVLGHADGVCHVYVDGKADLKMASEIAVDAKLQYPAVCNAAETLLVHKDIARKFLQDILVEYKAAGVEVRGDKKVRELFPQVDIVPASEEDWRTEYNDLVISVRVVDSLKEAVDHVNRYGSHHTDAIVTGDGKRARRFLKEVDSSSVMWNASTRFSDGFRYGLGAEVGISTNKIHARGPVGLEGLVIYKWVLEGKGHRVADYVGDYRREYTHKKLGRKW